LSFPAAMVDQNAASTVPGTNDSASYVFAIWNLVIRPPRATYNLSMLGPEEFEVRGQRGSRKDHDLKSSRGTLLKCSHFIPWHNGRMNMKAPVIIYMHGNSSNRLEAGNLVASLLTRGIGLFCYDASGCGLSEGEYVSLGWHERDDLAIIIDFLRKSPFSGKIGLWGRSMGAVTALLHADRDPSIGAMCLDSPFSSLRDLVIELAQSEHIAIHVPTWLLDVVLSFVRMRVKTLADFDIHDLVPLDHVKGSYVPALFVHGREDTFIVPKHSQRLFDNYAGEAEMRLFTGDHNTERGQESIDRIVDFFCRRLRHNVADQSVPSRDGLPNALPCAPQVDSALRGNSGVNSRLGAAARAAIKKGDAQKEKARSPSATFKGKENPENDVTRNTKATPRTRFGRSARTDLTPSKQPIVCRPATPPAPPTPMSILRSMR